jgi:hypothetical protein
MSATSVAFLPGHPLNQSPPAEGRKAKRKERKVTRHMQRLRMQALGGVGVLSVALFGIAVSLNHMAGGVGMLTKIPAWEAWAMAVFIDLGWGAFKGAELFCALDKTRKLIGPYTKWGVLGTMGVSSCLNAFGFAHNADPGIAAWCSAAFGAVLPFGILALGKVGAFMLTTAQQPSK